MKMILFYISVGLTTDQCLAPMNLSSPEIRSEGIRVEPCETHA